MINAIASAFFTPKGPTVNPQYQSPQRTWVGLTDEEIDELRSGYQSGRIGSFVSLARAIEAKLKEKNT